MLVRALTRATWESSLPSRLSTLSLDAIFAVAGPALCQAATMATATAPAPARFENGNGAATASAHKTASKQEFLQSFEKLKQELLDDDLITDQPAMARDWLDKMLQYNVPGGKLNRGMAVLDVLTTLKQHSVLSKDDVFKAHALGWCIEWLQAFFLVADDIMDNSITRRGQPCWYRQPQVGMVAINDGILLEACIYRILKQHFSGAPYYLQALELFHETTYQTSHGQLLDLITAPIGTVDLSRYTLPTYMGIVTFKTAYYSFYLPVACGLLIGGVTDAAAFAATKAICLQMGQYFQVQDDFLDCYGAPEVIGKVGTDIEDNKCSWLVVQALQLAQPQQLAVIKENYGKSDPAAVQKVKAVYKELDLEAVFRKYEQESYEKLVNAIDEQRVLPREVFTLLLNKIYKRQK